jgi:uncharacterized SAM-binding protein YcdF (DUF218 family)|tara:strand:+ start:190632 stop:191270 length:639 start_codon:yes stop_codon:yes gene_type:complete
MSNIIQEFNKISRYLLIEKTELARADAAMVFGNKTICRSLANEAANYFHLGYFPYIVVSGGVHCDPEDPLEHSIETEAERIAKFLQARGVPSERIIVENHATNTQQNVLNCKDIFNQHSSLNKAESIISFGNIKASRRFLMTLKAQWPEMFAMHVGVNGYGHPVQNWYEHDVFKRATLDQYQRIEPYIKRGWIAEVDIEDINRQARLMMKNN